MPQTTKNKRTPKKTAGISDEAVRAKTGKTWADWLRVIDRAGGKKMDHKSIAVFLHEQKKLSGWWAQMVTVGYEQARGMRVKHEKPGGFEIGASKTVNVPVSALFGAFKTKRTRDRWLGDEKIAVRRATANKSMRITWSDGKTHVDANFYGRGRGKSQVSVQHSKLTSATQSEKMKTFWRGRLAELKNALEA
jgi:hypothetical protein